MKTSELLSLQAEYVLGTYAPTTLITRGEGAYVWDGDNNRYLDFTSGIAVCNLGHCHPKVTAAIQEQAGKLLHMSNLYATEYQPQLAAPISKASFNGRVFFANSGAEANEGMIKFARKWGNPKGKHEIICMTGSFHGRTLAALAATARPKYREGFGPDMPGFTFVEFNNLDALKDAITDKTAAIMMEPIQGEGGVMPADPDFIKGARALCDEHELLLLFDEVQCGVARTGEYFGHQLYGVEPDAMSLAKGLGNGFPIGAFTVQRKWENVLGVGDHASTFGGTPIACAASLAAFKAIAEEDILARCKERGAYLKDALTIMASKHDTVVTDVRGVGLMLGMECTEPVADYLKKAADLGVLFLSAGPNVIRFVPPLIITDEQIDTAIGVLDQILEDMES